MHHALEALRDARDHLQNADAIFKGHRDAAIEQANKAIKQIEDALAAG